MLFVYRLTMSISVGGVPTARSIEACGTPAMTAVAGLDDAGRASRP